MTLVCKQAMVLAAGYGKRLHPLTLTTPKPLLTVAGKPLLEHVFDKLVKAGVEKIVINTHYLAENIHQFCHTYKEAEIIISHEPVVLETGGGILNALAFFDNKPFFSVNADIWWQKEPDSLLDSLKFAWDNEQMDALLTLIPKANALSYQGIGDYHQDTAGRLIYGQGVPAPYIYGGVQILHPLFFANAIPGPQSIVPLYHEAEKARRLYGYQFKGLWCDIGTLEAYASLNTYLRAA